MASYIIVSLVYEYSEQKTWIHDVKLKINMRYGKAYH